MKPPMPLILRRGAVIRVAGAEVADEHSMSRDLAMEFSGVDKRVLRDAPVEIVIEWNAELPEFD
jgi:hypothetical protein